MVSKLLTSTLNPCDRGINLPGYALTDYIELFSVETTLDADLQGYMSEKVQAARSPLIGFVAMEPTSGQIVSLVDHKQNNVFSHMGASSIFPAASIFKIITACAAIEHGKLSADSTLTYNGRGHTLYKKQLKKGTNRYTNRLSLKVE